MEVRKIRIALVRNDNSFIRHENCERFCFYCDSIGVRLNYTYAFGHCVIFSGNKVTASLSPSQVRSYPYAYINSSWNVIFYYCLLLFSTVIKILHNRDRTIPLFVLLFGFLFCVIFQISQILKVPVFFFVKREILILFPVNCEGTNLFCMKRDLDLHSPFTTLSVR